MVPPTSGSIIFNGIDIAKEKIKPKILYRDIQMVFQDT